MIDWEALAARQVTVPFKPFVDSDESVSNFDPEFTEADILKEAPIDTGNYYDDDPSSAWFDAGGGDGKARPAPVPINPSRDRMNGAGPGPLGDEAQDAFRGFSFSGDAELQDLMSAASMRDTSGEDDMRA
jgi:protein-serine/threonine kinase